MSGGGGRFNYRKKGRGVNLTLRGNQRGDLAYLMPLELIIIGDRNDQCIDTTLAESKWGTSPGIMSIELNIFGCV